MRDLYLEDFELGDLFTSPGLTVTEAQIIDFATQWDPVDFHMDLEVAKRHDFGGLIASGFHTLCITMRLFRQTGALDKCNIAGAGLDNLRWHAPVRPGDTIHLTAEVTESRPSSSRGDRGYVTMAYKVFNQRDEKVMSWRGIQIIRNRET